MSQEEELHHVAKYRAKGIVLLCLLIGVGFAMLFSGDRVDVAVHKSSLTMAGQMIRPTKARHSLVLTKDITPLHRIWQPKPLSKTRQFMQRVPTQAAVAEPIEKVLAQEADRFSGVIVKWDEDKQYGFIKPADGSEGVYLHVKSLSPESNTLRPGKGDLATYTRTFNKEKGRYIAKQVEVTPSDAEGRMKGKILRWNIEKHFGFIKPDDAADEIFCHMNNISTASVKVKGKHPCAEDLVTFVQTYDSEKDRYVASQVLVTPVKHLGHHGEEDGEMLVAPWGQLGGIVSKWNRMKGYGLLKELKPTSAGVPEVLEDNEIFCHFHSLVGEEYLNIGDIVTFNKEFNNRSGREEAVDIRLFTS